MNKSPLYIVPALIQQVSKACPIGKSEVAVRTVISRPLWKMWCRELGDDENCEPTEWIGIKETRRVYGSETIVVESDELFSFSAPT